MMEFKKQSFNFSKDEDLQKFNELPADNRREFIEKQEEDANKMLDKVKAGEAKSLKEALELVMIENLADNDEDFKSFLNSLPDDKNTKKKVLDVFQAFHSPELSGNNINDRIKNYINSGMEIRSFSKSADMVIDRAKTSDVFKLALQDAEKDNDFLDKLDEGTRKFVKLVQLADIYHNEIKDGRVTDFSEAGGIQFNEGDGGPKAFVLLGSEDSEWDYEAAYIKRIKREGEQFENSFEVFGLKQEICDSFGNHERGGGPYHIFNLDNIFLDLKNNLSDSSKKTIEDTVDSVTRLKIDKLEEERAAAEEKILEKISRYKKFENLDKDKLSFVTQYLNNNIASFQEENIGLSDDLLVIADIYFDSIVTNAEVTDKKVRRFHVVNVNDKTSTVSERESVLWRTTQKGLTGDDLCGAVTKIEIVNNEVKIELSNLEEISVGLDGLKEIKKPDLEKRLVFQKMIKDKFEDVRKSHKKIKIPVISRYPVVYGYAAHRDSQVGIANTSYDDNDEGATVTVWEEIDFEHVNSRILTQKRLTTYHVDSEKVYEVSSETQGFS